MTINIKKSIKVGCAIREMNQTELAELCDVNQPHISYITRVNSCGLLMIDKMAKALGYTSSEFIALGEK